MLAALRGKTTIIHHNKKISIMKKFSIIALFSFFAILITGQLSAQQRENVRPANVVYESPAAGARPVNILLRAGTPVDVEIMNNLDGKYVNQGQSVDFRVKFDIVVNNRTVVAAGSIAKGIVSRAQQGKGMGKAGVVEITPQYVQSVDGQFIPISGTPMIFEGKNRSGLAVGGVVLGIATGGIATAATGFLKGKNAQVPVGTSMTCSIASTREITVTTDY